MMPPSLPGGLDVSRADLSHAVEIVAGLMGKRPSGASIRFDDGWMFIEAGGGLAKVPARGTWPLAIVVGASWVRRLAKSMPAGDPVHLRVDHGRIYVNRYSERCAWTPVENPINPELPKLDEKQRIREAARILKPLLINTSDLEALVSEARAKGNASWSQEEKTMIAIVARAWVLLAPLRVENADIRRLMEKAVRNAWK